MSDQVSSVSEAISSAKRFVVLCQDGAQLCRDTSERINRPDFSHFLLNMADLKEEAIAEIRPFLEGKDEDMPGAGTMSGTTHRLLTNLYITFTDRDATESLMSQVLAAETNRLNRLRQVPLNPLPPTMRAKLKAWIGIFESSRIQLERFKQTA